MKKSQGNIEDKKQVNPKDKTKDEDQNIKSAPTRRQVLPLKKSQIALINFQRRLKTRKQVSPRMKNKSTPTKKRISRPHKWNSSELKNINKVLQHFIFTHHRKSSLLQKGRTFQGRLVKVIRSKFLGFSSLLRGSLYLPRDSLGFLWKKNTLFGARVSLHEWYCTWIGLISSKKS